MIICYFHSFYTDRTVQVGFFNYYPVLGFIFIYLKSDLLLFPYPISVAYPSISWLIQTCIILSGIIIFSSVNLNRQHPREFIYQLQTSSYLEGSPFLFIRNRHLKSFVQQVFVNLIDFLVIPSLVMIFQRQFLVLKS